MSGIIQILAAAKTAIPSLFVALSPGDTVTLGTTSPLLSGTETASPTGGTPPYTYAWTQTSGNTLTITTSLSLSTTFGSGPIGPSATKIGLMRCTVTDSTPVTPLTAYSECNIEFDRA